MTHQPHTPSPDAREQPDAATPRTGARPSTEAGDATPPVEVEVARTGGIAGITRRWAAQPPEDEASEWISLIDRCPWDQQHSRPGEPGARPIADGFVWRIRASWSGADPREAELPDDDVVGAWRELVDAVREWNRKAAAGERERPRG